MPASIAKTAFAACLIAAAFAAPAAAQSKNAKPAADTAVAKSSRFGRFARIAKAKAGQAVTKAEAATGMSREQMAKTALNVYTGGALTMVAGGSGTGGALRATTALAHEAVSQGTLTRAAKAARGAKAATATKGAKSGVVTRHTTGELTGMASSLDANGVPVVPSSFTADNQAGLLVGVGQGNDPKLVADYQSMAQRAMAGDKQALEEYTRLQKELMAGATRVAGEPADRQTDATGRLLRDAMHCAKTRHGCRAQ